MSVFTAPLAELAEFNTVLDAVRKKNFPVLITGCMDSQKSHLIHSIGEEAGKSGCKVVVTHNELRAKEILEDLSLYGRDVFYYPAKDVIFYSADVRGNAIVTGRMNVIKKLLENKSITIVTTIDAGMDRVLPLTQIKKHILELRTGEERELKELRNMLIVMGYENAIQVEAAGQFAVRGGILDIYPLTEECPYRIEFFDNEIDTIRSFDVESQRTMEHFDSLKIYPATEFVLSRSRIAQGTKAVEEAMKKQAEFFQKSGQLEECRRIKQIVGDFRENLEMCGGSLGMESYIPYFYKDTVSFFDYFEEDVLFYLEEPVRLSERGEAVEAEFRESMEGRLEKGYLLPLQMDAVFSCRSIVSKLEGKRGILLNAMEGVKSDFTPRVTASLTVQSVNSYQKNFELLIKDLKQWKKQGYRIILLSPFTSRAKRLAEEVRENGVEAYYSENKDRALLEGEIMVGTGNVHRGFLYPMLKFAVISESDIFGQEKKKKHRQKKYEGDRIHSFTELNVGDYVVHENFGIGIYRGIEKIEVDKTIKDYVKISYDKGGELYILATGLEVLQKYASADARKPKLNRLDSPEWKKTKSRVKSAVQEVAQNLVELYAARSEKEGFVFSPDNIWQEEFEEAFPFEETKDQLRAIEDTKRDMESTKIMDRLICGDVGFGKTEIAVRAAFKAVNDGKQVAFLVPTTILAQQHYNTLIQRMKDYAVNVELLSRFRTSAQQKKTIERLKGGQVDIVVGTHRLLSADVGFKSLGLLVVDEEQRFGVSHKEKIKEMKKNVDVLTLTATPIPRTLHMSLVGIRDMSVLDEPPVDRLPIQTFVMEHNDEIIREAIHREIARGGQVYYVYNRVQGIAEIADRVRSLVPQAEVAYAHGQMRERELEQIMYDFINGEIDVLIATTIVETGLDIANVNTMVIDDADRLGLAQLYQLRGRIGRSNRTSFAFLMYRRDKMLKEVAEKRLMAIREFTDLGSGFKIAMRDLEIRGAGSLLGESQHGHMEAVGYDLYCQMLNDAVKRLKGEKKEEEDFTTSMEIDRDAYIPVSYIKSEFQKLDIYKRIAEIGSREEYMDLQDELTDRFGDMPKEVENLLTIAFLKSMAHKAYITAVKSKEGMVELILHPKADIDINKIPKLLEKYGGALNFSAKEPPKFYYKENGRDTKQFFAYMEEVLTDLEKCKANLDDKQLS